MGIFRRDEDALGKARREAEQAGALERGEEFEVGSIEAGEYSPAPPEAPAPSRTETSTGDSRGWPGAPGPLGGGGTIGVGFPFWIPLVIVAVVLVLGGGIVAAVREGFDAADVGSEQPGIQAPAQSEEAPETSGSLVEPRNVARALVAIRERGRRALTVRIANDRIDAQVLRPGGMEIVQFTSGGLRVITETQNRPPVEGVDLRSISSRTPSRLVRRARAQANGAGLDYLVTTGVGTGGRDWTIVLRNGAQFVSDGDSGPLRRIG